MTPSAAINQATTMFLAWARMLVGGGDFTYTDRNGPHLYGLGSPLPKPLLSVRVGCCCLGR